eukprot:TRINITY_DN78603_c0_g1_i1.p1 TRINITY_DN78603_c0_g1~~TRINITY_DN78603_c0_g1_i1.p1  ORF type:complete len:209 (+),score=24.00 TRINITY_DN78603_c0_g1_i1:420-1046(+)
MVQSMVDLPVMIHRWPQLYVFGQFAASAVELHISSLGHFVFEYDITQMHFMPAWSNPQWGAAGMDISAETDQLQVANMVAATPIPDRVVLEVNFDDWALLWSESFLFRFRAWQHQMQLVPYFTWMVVSNGTLSWGCGLLFLIWWQNGRQNREKEKRQQLEHNMLCTLTKDNNKMMGSPLMGALAMSSLSGSSSSTSSSNYSNSVSSSD